MTASRLPATQTPVRHTLVLERADIARLPVNDLQELLLVVTGAGVVRRGVAGVQADAQLRGATFEELAVLVDGVRVNDAQTGHFHLSVPLPLAAIERIEVLFGPGSAVHGPDAFGGVIAITTGPPDGLTASAAAGEHALFQAVLSVPLAGGAWLAADRSASQGYRPDTEFSVSHAALGWRGVAGPWQMRASVAADEKEFGAWAFYSPRFPNEREDNAGVLLTAEARRPLASGDLSVRVGARQHRDVFWLDRAQPDSYRNQHRTRSALSQAVATGESLGFAWAAGVEGERQVIDSNRLGDHKRDRAAVFAEAARSFGRFTFAGQARGDHVAMLGWEVSPGLTLGVDLGRGVTLSAHRGRSFRLPSFTELYYVSPASMGNPALHAEHAWTDELTVRVPVGAWRLEAGAFRRRANDLIDFVRDDGGVYRAANYPHVTTDGVEVSASLPTLGLRSGLRIGAAYLSSTIEADPARSRYALAHPHLEAGATGALGLPFDTRADLTVRFRDPIRGPSYAVVDVRLSRPVAAGLVASLDVSNALDRAYREMEGIPMPGRWLSLGVTWRSHVP